MLEGPIGLHGEILIDGIPSRVDTALYALNAVLTGRDSNDIPTVRSASFDDDTSLPSSEEDSWDRLDEDLVV